MTMRTTRLALLPAILALVTGAACSSAARPPETAPQQTQAATGQDHAAHEAAAAAQAATAAAEAPAVVEPAADEAPTGWFCPMHPDVTASGPGKCRKCDMQLVAGNPFDTREYLLDISTSPVAVEPGRPFTLQLAVRHPNTGTIMRTFEEVHEKKFHLFVISQDMTHFQHIHPELAADGSWTIEVTIPTAGYYRVLADFLPAGGSPQFLGRPLVTAGFEEDLLAQAPELTPDTSEPKTVDGITATVSLDPEKLLAGQYGHITYRLTDAATGEPVTNLQPYLGAFGHTLVLSEDMLDVVHSHPSPGPGNDITQGAGGPQVTFEGYLPRPGLYRAWTQFLRNGRLSTFSYSFRVLSLDEAYPLRP